jgi:hypothetical protein
MAALSTVASIAAIGASIGTGVKALTMKAPKMSSATLPPPPSGPSKADRRRARDLIKLQQMRGKGGSGRASTILTGPQGVTSEPTTRKTLLGGGY